MWSKVYEHMTNTHGFLLKLLPQLFWTLQLYRMTLYGMYVLAYCSTRIMHHKQKSVNACLAKFIINFASQWYLKCWLSDWLLCPRPQSVLDPINAVIAEWANPTATLQSLEECLPRKMEAEGINLQWDIKQAQEGDPHTFKTHKFYKQVLFQDNLGVYMWISHWRKMLKEWQWQNSGCLDPFSLLPLCQKHVCKISLVIWRKTSIFSLSGSLFNWLCSLRLDSNRQIT